jgi:hypothetical protein
MSDYYRYQEPPKKQQAPTFVAVLIVAAALAFVAAVLLPVFASARQASYHTMAISRFRQVGTALQVYCSNYDDRYPLSRNWSSSCDPLLVGADERGVGMAFNSALNAFPGSSMDDVQQTIVIFESTKTEPNAYDHLTSIYWRGAGRCLVGRGDSSVKSIRETDHFGSVALNGPLGDPKLAPEPPAPKPKATIMGR